VVAGICDRVAVMHAGQIVERADVRRLFKQPAHPYTRGLLQSVPRLDREFVMEPIAGAVPSLLDPPPGCRFAPRCGLVMEACGVRRPPAVEIAPGHTVACLAVEGEAP
jgi:oligopeptide/dipeptide ABC transporter ATP-binding protein